MNKRERKRGKTNAKLRCIFENGTESAMLLRSLATELYKDPNGRRIVFPEEDLFDWVDKEKAKDLKTGFIYILKSLSLAPEIQQIRDLYKIGFSRVTVETRIQNAENEPTYLMAKVEIVKEYATYNMNPQKFEALLHRFFGKACMDLKVIDNDGFTHQPKEWFKAPLHTIETAINMLVSGDIVNYTYDIDTMSVVEKS